MRTLNIIKKFFTNPIMYFPIAVSMTLDFLWDKTHHVYYIYSSDLLIPNGNPNRIIEKDISLKNKLDEYGLGVLESNKWRINISTNCCLQIT